ncbi:MAG: hypothetical protein IPF44_14010 [Betaproteobacteria bacterium]|nr:hypothetical protein [Betaproteobacteria bacterium]
MGRHADAGDMNGNAPGDGGSDQLQVRNQTGGQMDGTDLRAVAELEGGGDQADDQRGRQFIHVVQFRPLDVADEEAEIQRRGQYDEETEDDLFQIHFASPRARPQLMLAGVYAPGALSPGAVKLACYVTN